MAREKVENDSDVAKNLGEKMKAVSVAEFFKKNKHLLGFDSPSKAMLIVVKEAVDNSLDATEDFAYAMSEKKVKYTPEIVVEINKSEHGLSIIPEDSDSAIADLVKTDKTWDLMLFDKKLRASKVDGDRKEYNVDGIKVEIIDNGGVKPKILIEGKNAKIEERTRKYHIKILDNGPGISEKNIGNVFGKLLYGSKFHRLRQSRGQQGIGISSAVLYAQQTTGLPAKVLTRTGKESKTFGMLLTISDANEPLVHEEWKQDEFPYEHGTSIEMTIEGEYLSSGERSVYEFIRRTAIVNPHVNFKLITPNKEKITFAKTTDELPAEPMEIKPHPHGMDLGMMKGLMDKTSARTVKGFLTSDLARVSPSIADDVLGKVDIDPNKKPGEVTRDELDKLLRALAKADIQRPPTDCLSPIGEAALRKSLLRDTKAEFISISSRRPTVYQGRPFLVEAAVAYGGEIKNEGACEKLRFGNKIPLLYDASACATTEALQGVAWKQYGVQSVATNGLPMGNYIILIHMASVWVPYTSEGKSAIASYDDVIKEMKLALQDCGRKLKGYLGGKVRANMKAQRTNMFAAYVPKMAETISLLTEEKQDAIEKDLKGMLKQSITEIEKQEAEDEKDTSDMTAPAAPTRENESGEEE